MKIITKANFTKVTLFATVLLAGCFFAGAANAQTVQGTFTLDHAARWGKTVLPAGDYRLKLDPGADPAMAVISDATSGKRVATVRDPSYRRRLQGPQRPAHRPARKPARDLFVPCG